MSPDPADNVIGRYRAVKALEHQIAGGAGFNCLLDGAEDPLADKNLAGRGFSAQSRGKVWHAADNRVVPALVETDPPDCRVATRDADAKTQRMTVLAPALGKLAHVITHSRGHAHGSLGMIGAWQRIVEYNEQSVAHEPFERSFMPDDVLSQAGVVFAEYRHHLLGFGGFGKGRETPEIAKYHGHFAAVAVEKRLALARRHHQVGDLCRQETPETAGALNLADLLGDSVFQRLVPRRDRLLLPGTS